MHLITLSTAILIPSATIAESLKWNLANVARFQNWRSLIRLYEDELADIANNNPVTILIPSNEAVSEFENSPAFQSASSEDIRQLLRYHVIKARHMSREIVAAGPFLETYLKHEGLRGGQRLQAASGGVEAKENSALEQVVFYSGLGQNASLPSGHSGRDFNADGTVLNLIDSVLTIPVSASDTALAAGLTSFAGAATVANIDLGAASDATFFVPTNNAFETVRSALTDASDSDLKNILKYHYIAGTDVPLYTSNIDTANPTTAEGSPIHFSYNSDNDLFVNSAAVTYANLLVSNGVIQIIDQVLNPESNSSTMPVGSVRLPAYPDATRTNTPPFADAVSCVQAPGDEGLSIGPAVTPLGSLNDDHKRQRHQIESSEAGQV